MEDTLVKTRNAFRGWAIWGTLFIVSFIFYPAALTSSWVSNSDVHSLLEFCAATIAFTAAGIVLIHFFATGRRFFLLISLGFTLQGAEDLVHAIHSFSRIWPAELGHSHVMENFIPGTYVAGRLILIVCILLALYLEKSASTAKNRAKEAVIYNSLGFLLAAIATAIVVHSPLPRFILPGQIISRPVDFMAAIIYLAAFFLFVRVYRDKEHHTPFMWCMIGSIIFGFAAQVYMVHSQQLYDAQFDISHALKIISYIFPIFGIGVGTLFMYKKEEALSNEIQRKNRDIGERIKELRCMYEVATFVRAKESLEEIFQDVAELIPPGWHYPEITRARICFGDNEYVSEPFEKTRWKQTSDIIVGGERHGCVEVYYTEERPMLDEGPFLKEERNLIDGIARALSEAAERKQAEDRIKAINQQLQANEQQLQAINQQLRANEQQLKAANQQLQAREKNLQQTNHNLGERIKELRCMYGVATSVRERQTLEEIFRDVTELIPPAWHYPEITRARICFDGAEYISGPFEQTQWKQTSDIIVGGERHGCVEVYYTEERPMLDEGPFLKEERNLIDGIARTLSEVTKRKKTESELKQKKEMLELASLSAYVALWDWDLETDVLEWSEIVDKMLGYGPGEFPRNLQMWEKTIHPEDYANVLEKLNDHLENKTPYTVEYRVRKKDGTYIWWYDSGRAFWDKDGKAYRMFGACIDITERKQAEEVAAQTYRQLEEANQGLKEVQSQMVQTEKLASIGQLAAGIAHEMNTPVGFVASNFQALESYVEKVKKLLGMYDELTTNIETLAKDELLNKAGIIGQSRRDMKIDFVLEDIQELFDDSREGLDRVTDIIQNLRDFSRIDQPGSLDKYDLNEAIKATLMVAQNEIKYDADIKTELSELPDILCHSGQINQVFLNILINAAQAIKSQEREDRGTITIRTYATETEVVCEISDDGPGIDPDALSKIFDPFFTTKQTGDGTGLGLSISYDIIVHKHNGKLIAESEVGKGTKFTIKLPINKEESDRRKEMTSDGKENGIICRR